MENEVNKLAEFKKQSTDVLYTFCNHNSLFTSGSPKQYQKFFDVAKYSKETDYLNYFALLAHLLWICSDRPDLREIDNLFQMLLKTYFDFCAKYEIG